MKLLEILIAPDGQTRITTKGFAGAACREASRFLETTLGTQLSEQLTGEYHASASQYQQQEQRT